MAKTQNVAQINAALVQKLTESSEIGYHVDDLAKSLNFATKKEVQNRLYDLQNKGEVQRLPGNKWRLTPAATEAVVESSTPVVGGAPPAAAPKAIPLNTHPALKLPGIAGFSSYKNSLQEYCQKLHYAVPQYTGEKLSGGYVATVNFGTNMVKGSVGRGAQKEADQQAAFEALIALEYLPREAVFQPPTAAPGQKRKEPPTPMDASGPPAKQVSLPTEPNQYKSKLNELAQKNQLPAPTYTTVSTPGGFFSTVTFNGREFKSSKCVRRKKESEQNAAHMAMYLLKQVPTPPEDFNAENGEAPNCDAIQSMIAEARATSTTVIPTAASAKNRLQEYCQQSKLPELPKYSTDMRQDKTVISSVEVGGNFYTGDVSASKKAAEQSAAMKALVNLGLAVPPPQNGAAAPMES